MMNGLVPALGHGRRALIGPGAHGRLIQLHVGRQFAAAGTDIVDTPAGGWQASMCSMPKFQFMA